MVNLTLNPNQSKLEHGHVQFIPLVVPQVILVGFLPEKIGNPWPDHAA